MPHVFNASIPASPYRRILVPIDGSAQSDRALDEAISIGRMHGGSLHLLAVLDETRYVNGFEPTRVVIDDLLPRARREVEGVLEAARARAVAAGVQAEVDMVVEGSESVAAIVCRKSTETAADLVVVGTHGRTGVDRLLLGSVADAILRRCPVPVLLVRTADEAAAAA